MIHIIHTVCTCKRFSRAHAFQLANRRHREALGITVQTRTYIAHTICIILFSQFIRGFCTQWPHHIGTHMHAYTYSCGAFSQMLNDNCTFRIIVIKFLSFSRFCSRVPCCLFFACFVGHVLFNDSESKELFNKPDSDALRTQTNSNNTKAENQHCIQ